MMKKLFLLILFLVACTPKPEVIKDPIFEENYIRHDKCGKAYIVQDPLFEDNYMIFEEPCEDYSTK
jgi:hypothetical protein